MGVYYVWERSKVHRTPESHNVKGRVLLGDLGVDEINTQIPDLWNAFS